MSQVGQTMKRISHTVREELDSPARGGTRSPAKDGATVTKVVTRTTVKQTGQVDHTDIDI